ncbi:MAG: helix-turn-helix domain-containing protein [Thermodesulfobacterium sp.]|nr:helix-turn-helix domain-containing protein [Thermodesulfobacterium sp.]
MNDLLSPSEVKKILHLSEGTLGNWRSCKKHLPYIKVGRRVLYRRRDIEKFVERRRGKVSE